MRDPGWALIRTLEPQTARLEDLFFSLTEGAASDDGAAAEGGAAGPSSPDDPAPARSPDDPSPAPEAVA